jgi:hypothetical protein
MVSYIVGSEVTTVAPPDDTFLVGPQFERRFARLRPEFGFKIVTWSPSAPLIVRETIWNTEKERRETPLVGVIRQRRASDQEIQDGERQHAAAGATRTHMAADELDRIRKLLARAAFVAEHLMEMIPPETWRDHGAFVEGVYEGDYRAEQTEAEIQEWKKAAR